MATCSMSCIGILKSGREVWECKTHKQAVFRDLDEDPPEHCPQSEKKERKQNWRNQ